MTIFFLSTIVLALASQSHASLRPGFLKDSGRNLQATCWACTSLPANCITCDSIRQEGDFKYATINLFGCKGSEISWACCTTPECTISSCFGNGHVISENRAKCESTTSITVKVPVGTTSVEINTHDGRTLGNSAANTGVCVPGQNDPFSQQGCQTDSGHCLVPIELSTCGGGGPICPAGSDETHCQEIDDADPCNTYTFVGVESGAPICTCTPSPVVGQECASEDISQCKAARVCEVNDGVGVCGQAGFLDSSTKCRNADGACDADDFCTGNSYGCPDDLKPTRHECRPAQDSCDIPDYCDGLNKDCPCDKVRSSGYSLKCGTTIYLCGVTQDELDQGNGGVSVLGGCTIGKGQTFVPLEYPGCAFADIEALCPNDKGLSNYALATCVPDAGWTCDQKVDVSSTTELPFTPYPDFTECDGGDGGGGGSDPETCTCESGATAVCLL